MRKKLLLPLALFLFSSSLQAQWLEENNGLYGGSVTALVANGGNLFAGTDYAGVFLSTNNGSSWTAVNTGLTNIDVNCLAASNNNLFAGTFKGGVFLSTNNGTSWAEVNVGLPSETSVSSFAVSGNNLFAGTDRGVFLSSNNGSSWTAVNSGLPNIAVNTLVVSGINLYAATYGEGIFRSSNNGASWTAINEGLGNLFLHALAVGGSNLYAATNDRLLRSTNNGASWTAVNTGLTSSYVSSLAVSGSNLFVDTPDGVFLSTNNGSSWTGVSSGLPNTSGNRLVADNGNLYACTSGAGIFRSTNNGANWTGINAGLNNIIARTFVTSGSKLFTGTNGAGVFRSTNNGTSWTEVNNGLTNTNVNSLFLSGNNLYAGTTGGVFLSINDGENWTAINSGLTDDTFVICFAISGNNIFAGTINGVFRSSNDGSSWEAANTGLINTHVQSLAVSGSNIYAGTYGGGVFRSSNNGANWTAVNAGLTSNDVRSLLINDNNLFAGCSSNQVFLSTNNGSSWKAVKIPIAGSVYSDVESLTVSGSKVYAGTFGNGVFYSANNGSSWAAENTGLTNKLINSLIVSSGNLYAGTWGTGVWSRPLAEFTIPTITSFEPTSGPIGTFVTITGTNFSSKSTNNIVEFNGVTATVIACTTTSITAIVPATITGKIKVTVNNMTAESDTDFSVAPAIDNFSPTSGPIGTSVTITGTNFSSIPANNIVNFNGVTATVMASTTTSITAIVPATSTGKIRVTVNEITAVSDTDFSVAPAIESFSPTSGPLGTFVTIKGTNFSSIPANNIVKFNGVTATVTASTSTSITAIVPATSTGRIQVTANGLTAVSSADFASQSQPTISSFLPVSGPIGTSVTIMGTNFNTTAANNIVIFGATRADVTAATATQLTVTVPKGATYAPITVLNAPTGLLAYSNSNFTPTFTPNKGNVTSADFSDKVDFTTGTIPYSVAIADLDGDGRADLVVVNNASNTVSVFRNTSGSGSITSSSFATKVDFTTGLNPIFVTIGDLDGDGKADLVVANYNSGTVSVLRNTSNNGSITPSSFAAKVDFTTGLNPISVTIGDLNGDGRIDLIVPNGDMISVFRNTGSSGSITPSSFAAKVDFTTGFSSASIAAGDLDGDGKADLAVANYSSSTVSVFRNTGSSSITSSSFAPNVDFATGLRPVSVAIGDLDGDGKADLAVANNGSSTVSVFRNTGSSGSITPSSFAAKVDFTSGSTPRSVAIGDLNGDGKPDLAVANGSTYTVSVFSNKGTKGSITSSSFASQVYFTTGSYPISVATGDLDGDGKPDLVVANYESNTFSVIRNNPVFAPPPTIASFSPSSGIVGALVTINGTNFSTIPANNNVTFNGVRATVTASNSTSITAYVPATSTGRIQVTVDGITAISSADFTVERPPTISSFSPISGPIGTSVTITGTNFSGIPANNMVKFNGIAASVTASTSTTITAVLPTGASSGTISVTLDGNTATSANFFGVDVKACGVSFLDPGGVGTYTNNQTYAQTFSPVNPTEKVTVSFASFNLEDGYDFLKVYNGSSTASPLLVALTGTNLPNNITSSASGGELTFLFTSDELDVGSGWAATISCGVAPTISSFAPVSGAIGTPITITGTNFSTISANNIVKFNGVQATVISSTASTITAAVPSGAISGTISVAIAGQTAFSTTNFTVLLPSPTITSFSPNIGAAGTSILITGTNFDALKGNSTVTINGQAATITGISPTSIIITVPAAATTGKIGVSVVGQVAISTTDFTVLTFSGEWVQKSNGLYNMLVPTLFSNSGNLYAATNNGVYLSTDNGNSWTSLGLPNTYVGSLAVSEGNLYAGCIDGRGIFRSKNNGASWTPINTGLTANVAVLSLLVNGSNLYAGTNAGVFHSTNNGDNWTAINDLSLTVNSIVYSLSVSDGNLYAATVGGVFRSTNNGSSWAAINTGLAANPVVVSLLVSGSNLYVVTDAGVFVSANNGNSWTPIYSKLTDNSIIYSFAVNDSNLYVGTNGGVFLSTDNGKSWTALNMGLNSNNVYSLTVNDDNLFAGTGKGVFRFPKNGESWTGVNSGLATTNVRSLYTNNSTIYVGTNEVGISRSNNNGESWTSVNSGLTSYTVYSFAAKGSNTFAGTFNKGIFRSTNNGETWTDVNVGLPITTIRALAVSGNNLFAGTNSNGVYISNNDGESWTQVNNGLTNFNIRAFAAKGNNLFVGTFGGGVFLSNNNGGSWTKVNSGLTNFDVYSFAVIGDNLFAGTNGGGVFLSTNNGSSWSSISAGLPTTWVYSLAVSGNSLFAGTIGNGVFLSANNGASWTDISRGLKSTQIQSLTVSSSYLFAGTTGGGVWARPLTDFASFVSKQSQNITFASLPDKLITDVPFSLTATASSNLPVSFSSTSDKITINGTQVTLVKAGRASIVASQPGNDRFNPAEIVTQNFCIKPTKPTIASTNNAGTVTLTSGAAVGNQWYLAGNMVSGATNQSISVTASGVYKVQVTVDDCVSEFSEEQPVVITGDVEEEAYISVSPNPVEDALQLSGIIGEVKSIQLFDMTGRAGTVIEIEKNNELYQTSAAHLSPGVYVLRIFMADNLVQVKFIKK
jgi:photosystem II stability/assembly factor-like uncharacterized protein